MTLKNQAVDEFNRTKIRMTSDIKTVVADDEDLLKVTAEVFGDGIAVARQKFEEALEVAQIMLANASEAAVGTGRQHAAVVDQAQAPGERNNPVAPCTFLMAVTT